MRNYLTVLAILLGPVLMWGQQYHTKQASLPCLNKEFNVVAHIVRDSLGELNITEEKIDSAIMLLNERFEPMCVSFKLCDVRIIDNFQYDNSENENEWTEMEVKYLVERRINIFYVQSIPWTEIQDACGLAPVGGISDTEGDHNSILAVKECPINALVHEMGHFFGLYHTFETEFGEELVDGSNCETAGDLVCDTPADPYVINTPAENYVDEEQGCRFIDGSSDANGAPYIPHVANIMSYYQDACLCGFTHGQFLRMAATYLQAPAEYW
ncbi:MAG: M43 family zinc metalloprotease [Saprospiraceae bacterium]|nr:hypothetical protein [Lewinella sp.]